jgi:hypothetical protein
LPLKIISSGVIKRKRKNGNTKQNRRDLYPYTQFSSKLLAGSTPLKISVLARLQHPGRKVQTPKKEIEMKL